MNKLYSLTVLIIIACTMPVYAIDNLTINKNDAKIFLGNRCETLEDKYGNISVFSIISGDLDSSFKQVKI